MPRTALLIGGAGGTGVLLAHGLRDRGFDVTILHRGVHEPSDIAQFAHIHADPHFAETLAPALGAASYDLVVATYGRIRVLAPIFAGRCQRFLAVGGIPIYAGYLDPGSVRPTGMKILSREDAPLGEAAAMQPAGAASFAAKMRATEEAVMEQHDSGGFEASIFRYPAVYGPRSITNGDWSVIKRVRDGRRFILAPNEGIGIITRCAAVNCAHAVLLSIDCDAAKGRTFNLADDDQYTLGQWMELMLDFLGSDIEIVGIPKCLNWVAAHLLPLSGTVSDQSIVDASAARELLGFRDVLPAREALIQALEWRLKNPPDEADYRAWGDPYDYDVEDEVFRRLNAFKAECAEIARVSPPVHPYPHPKEPSLEADHRGR